MSKPTPFHLVSEFQTKAFFGLMRVQSFDRYFKSMVLIAAGLVLLSFGWILWDLLSKGWGKLSWAFLTELPASSGRKGGVSSLLVSSLLLLGVALAAAIPLGLACAVWLSEYTKADTQYARTVRLSLDVLAGVPSIVFGLFGNALFSVALGLGFSIWAGGLTLACMVLPILIRSTELGLAGVPSDWRSAGAALGMSRLSVLWRVLLPAAAPAVLAGLMLGIGRALAETAALIFTSGYVDRMPEGLSDSGRSLAVHIYDLAMNVPGGERAAYGSALVLIALLFIINGSAIFMSNRWLGKHIEKDS